MQTGIFPTGSKCDVIVTKSGVHHMIAHPIEDNILHEAFGLLTLSRMDNKFWKGTVDLGRIVGLEGRVAVPTVGVDEPTTFAHRHNRKRASHCSVAEAQETSQITVVLRRGSNTNNAFFVSAWCGTAADKEPTNLNDRVPLDFWCNNALIWNDRSFYEPPFTSTWREVLSKR
jgi:hypothetical protein